MDTYMFQETIKWSTDLSNLPQVWNKPNVRNIFYGISTRTIQRVPSVRHIRLNRLLRQYDHSRWIN